MIGIVGYMSGGKTYYAVERILGLLLSNHTICTNIHLNCQAVSSYLGVPCVMWKRLLYILEDPPTPGYHHIDLRDYSSYPQGSPRGSATYDRDMVYVFLDEASSCFDSMVHASDSSINAVATWARHTRKRGIEVVLLMQFASELNKRLRNHIVEYVSCTNSDNLKLPVVGTGLPWFLRGLSVRQRYASDLETPIGDSHWARFNPAVYRCYNTAQIVVGGGSLALDPPVKLDYREKMIREQFSRLCVSLLVWLFVVVGCGVWLWVGIKIRSSACVF